jgi:DegV family protein with EDD domain
VSVTVVTDSAASLPPELAAEAGISVVPLALIVGDDTYDDGQLPLADLLARPPGAVSTSGPTPGRVAVALEAALDTADHALVLTIAHAMSSTFDAAHLAARPFGERVRVLDTETAAGAEGLVALAAAHRAAAGAGIDEVQAAARQAIDGVRLVATVPDLERLVASGRVPGMAGWAGSRLGVNPLFEFRSGRVRPVRPAFSRENALARILSALRGSAGPPGASLHVAAVHAEASADADCLLEGARAVTEPATAFVGTFSPVMVTHTGAGLVGLAWWWEPAT